MERILIPLALIILSDQKKKVDLIILGATVDKIQELLILLRILPRIHLSIFLVGGIWVVNKTTQDSRVKHRFKIHFLLRRRQIQTPYLDLQGLLLDLAEMLQNITYYDYTLTDS